MIIRMLGGLGNQMYQYAFAKAYSLEKKTKIYLDNAFYKKNSATNRVYQLDSAFNINALLISPILLRLARKLKIIKKYNQQTNFDKNAFLQPSNTYFDGHWGNYKYFDKHHSAIIKEFSFNKRKISQSTLELAEQMSKEKSIALHIRRGDYVKDLAVNSHHGTCTLSYYQEAVSYLIAELGSDVVVYLFSDDLDWVENNLFLPCKTLFVKNKSDVEDLFLMSKTKHNIIANSTFSWWGAYLNCNTYKYVIAPSHWNNKGFNTREIIPDDWIII